MSLSLVFVVLAHGLLNLLLDGLVLNLEIALELLVPYQFGNVVSKDSKCFLNLV